MKKIYSIMLAALSFSTYVNAQENNVINITGPTFIEEFSQNNITATGISPNGRFVFGTSQNGSAAIYDFEGEKAFTLIAPEKNSNTSVTIAGATPDNKIIVSNYTYSYIYNIEDGSKEMIESPDFSFGIDVWDVSNDGKFIACNFISEQFAIFPAIGVLQEDGTYEISDLDYNSTDAMGCESQYTQARFISDDGKYVMGIQTDYRGMGGRPVVWTLQDDNKYTFSSPMDEYIYDFSFESPGMVPQWHEYVTADQVKEPDLFEKQNEEYLEAFNKYIENYNNFTRNGSSFEMYKMVKGARNNTLCSGYYDYRTDKEKGGMIPVFYNCEENKITEYPNVAISASGVPMSIGVDELPGGGHIFATSQYDIYELSIVDKDGNTKSFQQWLKDLSGTDISEHYTFTYYDSTTGTTKNGVFLGMPYFCDNGKALLLSTFNSNKQPVASVIRFDRDIYDAVNTGIEENIVENINVKGNIINIGSGKHAIAEVYTMSGSLWGSYNINGLFNFSNTLPQGSYIVKIITDSSKPISVKMNIK